VNTNQILSNLRKQKKKIDGERERLHHAIVAFEKLAGKAFEAGKKKYKMSRAEKKLRRARRSVGQNSKRTKPRNPDR
jgi:hypothetical protein